MIDEAYLEQMGTNSENKLKVSITERKVWTSPAILTSEKRDARKNVWLMALREIVGRD